MPQISSTYYYLLSLLSNIWKMFSFCNPSHPYLDATTFYFKKWRNSREREAAYFRDLPFRRGHWRPLIERSIWAIWCIPFFHKLYLLFLLPLELTRWSETQALMQWSSEISIMSPWKCKKCKRKKCRRMLLGHQPQDHFWLPLI